MIGFAIAISLYAIACLTHLVFGFLENEKWRKLTKCFCMGILFIAALFIVPHQPIIYISIALAFFGDLFLLKDDYLHLTIGATCFALMHVVNIYFISSHLNYSIHWAVFVVAFIIFIFIILYGKLSKRNLPPIVHQGALGYFFILLFSTTMAGMLLVNQVNTYTIMIFIGYLLFLCSDTCLLIFNFFHSVKRKNFWIMLTYLSAQTLIYLGMILLS